MISLKNINWRCFKMFMSYLLLKHWDDALKLGNLSKVDKLKAYFGNKGNQCLWFIRTMS